MLVLGVQTGTVDRVLGNRAGLGTGCSDFDSGTGNRISVRLDGETPDTAFVDRVVGSRIHFVDAPVIDLAECEPAWFEHRVDLVLTDEDTSRISPAGIVDVGETRPEIHIVRRSVLARRPVQIRLAGNIRGAVPRLRVGSAAGNEPLVVQVLLHADPFLVRQRSIIDQQFTQLDAAGTVGPVAGQHAGFDVAGRDEADDRVVGRQDCGGAVHLLTVQIGRAGTDVGMGPVVDSVPDLIGGSTMEVVVVVVSQEKTICPGVHPAYPEHGPDIADVQHGAGGAAKLHPGAVRRQGIAVGRIAEIHDRLAAESPTDIRGLLSLFGLVRIMVVSRKVVPPADLVSLQHQTAGLGGI